MKIILTITLLIFTISQTSEETIKVFLVGDSTVAGYSGTTLQDKRGWGAFLGDHFDTTQVTIINKARGGRSSRSYIREWLWDDVHNQLDSGDYVLIQFGHNDSGAINDDHRARGSIGGNSDTTLIIDNILTRQREIVKSYGWYIRKYIADTRAKGAIPIVCSHIARDRWTDGKVDRATDSYTKWAREAAEQENALFIDLNDLTATAYEQAGVTYTSDTLFSQDNTHTTIYGAQLNAKVLAEAIKNLENCDLKNYLK